MSFLTVFLCRSKIRSRSPAEGKGSENVENQCFRAFLLKHGSNIVISTYSLVIFRKMIKRQIYDDEHQQYIIVKSVSLKRRRGCCVRRGKHEKL